MKTNFVWIGLALAAALVLGGACSDDPTSSGTANVSVYLTDAPIDLTGVTAVNVTIQEIVLFPVGAEDGGGIPLDLTGTGPLTVNLLDYRDGQVILAAAQEVPAGDYERIHLTVSDAEILRDHDLDPETPDLSEDVWVPPGKINVPVPFTVAQNEDLDVILDFDAAASIQINETGNEKYILRPVITPVGVNAS